MSKVKPYYKIEADTEIIIKGLAEKCKELNLGNCSFDSYNGQCFYILEFKDYWELRVVSEPSRDKRYMDIYKITDNGLIYQYTE